MIEIHFNCLEYFSFNCSVYPVLTLEFHVIFQFLGRRNWEDPANESLLNSVILLYCLPILPN